MACSQCAQRAHKLFTKWSYSEPVPDQVPARTWSNGLVTISFLTFTLDHWHTRAAILAFVARVLFGKKKAVVRQATPDEIANFHKNG